MRFYAERDSGPLAVSFFERVLQLFRAAARERGIYCRGRHLLSAAGGKYGPASTGCAAFHTRRPRWEMAGIFYLDWETVFDSFCSLSVLNREPVLKAELLPGDLERYQKLLQSLKATPDSLLPLRIPEMEKEILRMYGYHAHRVNLQRDPIEAACDMLSQNLDEEISLEELARSLQIGYETFRKVFKKQTGVSPARYRTRKKMEQARILLEGGVPMKEIAVLVGYGDVYAFSKQFSRFFGFPPGKYRARLHTDALDLEQF